QQLSLFSHPSKCSIRAGAFSLNSRLSLQARRGRQPLPLDVPSQSLLRCLSGHCGSVLGLAFATAGSRVRRRQRTTCRVLGRDSSDGQRRCSLLDGHDLGVAELTSHPALPIRLPLPGPHPEPGSRRAAAPCYTVATGAAIIYSSALRQRLPTSAASGPNGGFRDHTVRIWKPETASSLHVVEAHARYVTSCCFSSDGRRLASGSNDRLVRVWDLAIEELPDSADTGQQARRAARLAATIQKLPTSPISTWTVDEVARLLDGLGLRELLPAFRRDRVDGSALLSLTDRRLRDQLGVEVAADRRKILKAVASLRGPAIGLRSRPST
uniref:SAM domain-containing protein n=1 Tax=Macrostomum lignano TaxID=282301 RepID=A0A1I8FJ68_9PLAT